MNSVICKNIFITNNEAERKEKFNEIWQKIIKQIMNNYES